MNIWLRVFIIIAIYIDLTFVISCRDNKNPKIEIVDQQRMIQRAMIENQQWWDSIRLNRIKTDTSNPFFNLAVYTYKKDSLNKAFDSLEMELKKY